MDYFSRGFVEILAAEQTPENANWFQGTADAVRQAMRHFLPLEAEYYLILAGDHLYRMDFRELLDAHIESGADITIAAQPIGIEDASSMGIFRFDRQGRIEAFEEKPNRARLDQIGRSVPDGAAMGTRPAGRQALRRLDGHLCLLARRAHRAAAIEQQRRLRPRSDSLRPRHPQRSRLLLQRLLGRRRHHRVVLRRQHAADAARGAVPVLRSDAADLHARAFLPPATVDACTITRSAIAEGVH